MMSAQLSDNQTPLAVALSVRRLVEFLLRTGSIDSRFQDSTAPTRVPESTVGCSALPLKSMKITKPKWH